MISKVAFDLSHSYHPGFIVQREEIYLEAQGGRREHGRDAAQQPKGVVAIAKENRL
jgi:hypothetical protein